MKTTKLFESLAGATWFSINSSHNNRIHLGEDAITSYMLNTIAYSNLRSVIYDDTRANESTKGCDFELWLGNDACGGWYRYAIQAKKINYADSRYASLTHHVRGKRQIDVLTSYAAKNNATALYCFYNYSTDVVPWNCKEKQDITQLGISIAPTESVDDAIKTRGGKNYTYIHKKPKTIPWRCLVKCPLLAPCKLESNDFTHMFGSTKIETLPSPLNQLLEQAASNDPYSRELRPEVPNEPYSTNIDIDDIYNRDCEYRAKRIVVIETQNDDIA